MKLSSLKVKRLVEPGSYADGGGLYLQVRGPRNRSWIFRYKLHGKSHLMGLGPEDVVTLAEARQAALAARKLVHQGTDPIAHRRAERENEAAHRAAHTFKSAAEAYIAAHAPGWRNPKHREQWRATLETYAFPHMGALPVAEVDTAHVMAALEPIWTAKPETAARVRGRIEAVLDLARARGWRNGENPARWRGHVANMLPKRSKVAAVEHHAALPWREMGAFMATLAAHEPNSVAALALRFVILTAARTGEAIGARWREIDLENALWTVPAERMKAGREHRVPLSTSALDTLAAARRLSEGGPADFVFPGGKPGAGLSSMALAMLLRRMGRSDLTVHGMRSSFRDWAAEATSFDRETAEAALAHTVRDKVEAAYRRGDLMAKRRALMEAWAAFAGREEMPNAA